MRNDFRQSLSREQYTIEFKVDNRKQIQANEVVTDIRSGLGDDGIMTKYSISEKGLKALFKKLLAMKLITHDELCRGSSFYERRIDRIKSRGHPRADLVVEIPIYDVTSGTMGIVRDISEKGFRVAGISAKVGDERWFQIPVDRYILADPLMVIAECRWVAVKGRNKKYAVAGFELKDVSSVDEKLLKDFIDFLLLSKSGEWLTVGDKPK